MTTQTDMKEGWSNPVFLEFAETHDPEQNIWYSISRHLRFDVPRGAICFSPWGVRAEQRIQSPLLFSFDCVRDGGDALGWHRLEVRLRGLQSI